MKPYNKLNKQDKENIIKNYNNGFCIPQVAKKLGVSQRSVPRVLRENNIYTLRKNRYTLNEDYFEKINTEQKAYILGFMLADGYVNNKTNYIVIQLKEDDLKLLEDIAKAINYTGEIRYIPPQESRYSNYGCYRLAFSSKKIALDLYRHGLYKGKSLTINKLPSVPQDLKRHLIRGIFDGDGSIIVTPHTIQKYEPSPTFSIICTPEIANEIKQYFVEKAKSTSGYIKQSKTKELVYLEIRGNHNLLKIYHELYDDASIYLKRKYEKFNTIRPLREETLVSKSV